MIHIIWKVWGKFLVLSSMEIFLLNQVLLLILRIDFTQQRKKEEKNCDHDFLVFGYLVYVRCNFSHYFFFLWKRDLQTMRFDWCPKYSKFLSCMMTIASQLCVEVFLLESLFCNVKSGKLQYVSTKICDNDL